MVKKELVRTYKIRSSKGRQNMEKKFHRAVEQSNVSLVEDCMAKGVDPNIFDDEGLTALHIAATKGDLRLGQKLMEAENINVNIPTLEGTTPLMLACIYENEYFVKALLDNGADPNLCNDKEQCALHMAVTAGNMGIIHELTSRGAKINVVDVFDSTPLSIAVTKYPSESVIRYLLSKGANATSTKQFPLLLECVLNCNSVKQLNILKILLSYDVDINCLHPISKRNCLHYVAMTGYLPAAEYLLQNGANLHHIDRSRRTPLQIARDHENKEIIKLFRYWENLRRI